MTSLCGLPPALPAERFEVDGLGCYTAGQGPPLLLVHSVNAAASAAEVRPVLAPVYEAFSATRTVFAIDLPGNGFSSRTDCAYTPRLMTDALHALAAQTQKVAGWVRGLPSKRWRCRWAANSWPARRPGSQRCGAGWRWSAPPA